MQIIKNVTKVLILIALVINIVTCGEKKIEEKAAVIKPVKTMIVGQGVRKHRQY